MVLAQIDVQLHHWSGVSPKLMHRRPLRVLQLHRRRRSISIIQEDCFCYSTKYMTWLKVRLGYSTYKSNYKYMMKHGTMVEDKYSGVGQVKCVEMWGRVWAGRVSFDRRCKKTIFSRMNDLTHANFFDCQCNWIPAHSTLTFRLWAEGSRINQGY